MGVHQELKGNMEHTGNQIKMKKKTKKAKKTQGTLIACLGLPICCMKFLFPKEFITIINWGHLFLFHINQLGVPHKSNVFVFGKKKKVETMEAPQNRRFYGKMECFPLWPKSKALLGTSLGYTLGTQGTFWAWANTHIINWGYIFVAILSPNKSQI